VTQAAAADSRFVPLYLVLLPRGLNPRPGEGGSIKSRVCSTIIFAVSTPQVDSARRIRVDDWEIRDDVHGGVRHLPRDLDGESADR